MGYAGKLIEKQKAKKLRKKGLSYNEIQKIVRVSKSTLSLWCRNIILSPRQMSKLKGKRIRGAAKGRIIGAKKQQDRRIKETKELLNKGKKEIGKLSKRDKFVAGIALYAADGTKIDRHVAFTNANPKLIKLMMEWFREFCIIDESKYKAEIWIHENRNEKKAKEYWSKLTKIPLSQFHKSYIAENKTKSKKIRKNVHNYGVLGIRMSNAKLHRKIMGWIAGILEG